MPDTQPAFNPLFDAPPGSEISTPPPEPVDPEAVRELTEALHTQQNLRRGIAGGVASALIGAGAWALITVVTEYQHSAMAMGVGALVGLAVRKYGHGISRRFGVAGAFLALFGALLGNLLSIGGLVAKIGGLPLLAVEAHLLTSPVAAANALAGSFVPIDILFYVITLIAGYHFSFRELVESDIVRMVRHSTTEEDDV
jgi:hypothetical protein